MSNAKTYNQTLYIPLRSDKTAVFTVLATLAAWLYIPLRSDKTHSTLNSVWRKNFLYIPLRSDKTVLGMIDKWGGFAFISHYVQIKQSQLLSR